MTQNSTNTWKTMPPEALPKVQSWEPIWRDTGWISMVVGVVPPSASVTSEAGEICRNHIPNLFVLDSFQQLFHSMSWYGCYFCWMDNVLWRPQQRVPHLEWGWLVSSNSWTFVLECALGYGLLIFSPDMEYKGVGLPSSWLAIVWVRYWCSQIWVPCGKLGRPLIRLARMARILAHVLWKLFKSRFL